MRDGPDLLADVLKTTTQQKVAEKVGTCQQRISNWLRRKGGPNGFQQAAFEAAYGIPVWSWFNREQRLALEALKRERARHEERSSSQTSRGRKRRELAEVESAPAHAEDTRTLPLFPETQRTR